MMVCPAWAEDGPAWQDEEALRADIDSLHKRVLVLEDRLARQETLTGLLMAEHQLKYKIDAAEELKSNAQP